MNKIEQKSNDDFKTIKFVSEVRGKISNDIKDMNFAEIQRYLLERRTKINSRSKG